MSSEAVTGTRRRRRLARAVAVSGIGAAVLTAVMAIPAQAATWTINGPYRSTFAAAEADRPGLEAQCRQQDGNVYNSKTRWLGLEGGDLVYYGYVECQSKRG